MAVNLKYGYIFKTTAQAFDSGKKIIVHKGGTGSGKTFDLMIFIIFYVALRHPNWVITVVSESKPHLDIGAIRIMKNLLLQTEVFSSDEFNVSTSRYTFKNGTILEFFSADRIDKALGARRNLLYGNEINSLKFEVFDELARRSEYVLADFNPTQQFWLEKFIEYYGETGNNGEIELITSNYKNNPFLPDVERSRIERRATIDSNFRRIHVDCEYGSYEGLVFEQFNIIEDMPDIEGLYGLDWGYTNDPTSIIRVGISGSGLYLDELLYRTGLTNSDISGLLPSLGIQKNYSQLIADSAEPKSIEDLYRAGYNIKPAVKGPDSVRNGIDCMKGFTIHVTKRSVNLIKELRNYSWVMDKEGNPTNKPIDAYNHAIDAARYAAMKLVIPVVEDFIL